MNVDVLIVGAGPTGLGAATRLEELCANGVARRSYLLVDAQSSPGGWARSVTTRQGFTFDCGGHVLYPHRHHVRFGDRLKALPIEWHSSVPKRGVLIDGRLIPYPVQRNIHKLSVHDAAVCLMGLFRARLRSVCSGEPMHYDDCSLRDHLLKHFGAGVTNLILKPLNEKMWALPIEDLDSSWARYRSGSSIPNVARVSLLRLLRNFILRRDDPGWTPETRVAYPRFGGTGAIWAHIAQTLPQENLVLNRRVIAFDTRRRVATFHDGLQIKYDTLLSSMPLDVLLKACRDRSDLNVFADDLIYSTTSVFGFGVKGDMPNWLKDVHSFHVPDKRMPFWRVTLPSALSPGNVPGDGYWSILCETSEPHSPHPGTDVPALMRQSERALIRSGILPATARIVSRWSTSIDHGYPTPFRGRDALLSDIHQRLQSCGVYSRGRFGGWRYEISNQDDSFMQGVEIVEALVSGIPEKIYTFPKDGPPYSHAVSSVGS